MDLYREAARLIDRAAAERDRDKAQHIRLAAWELYQAYRAVSVQGPVGVRDDRQAGR